MIHHHHNLNHIIPLLLAILDNNNDVLLAISTTITIYYIIQYIFELTPAKSTTIIGAKAQSTQNGENIEVVYESYGRRAYLNFYERYPMK